MIWKKVKKSKVYYASSCGLIGSKYIKGLRGESGKSINILKQSTCGSGYNTVHLYENGKRKTRMVHRLVAEAFFGVSKLYVNHKNLIKTDNRIENLEYVTAKENYQHARHKGVMKLPPNSSYKRRKLTKKQIFEILSNREI